MSKAKPEIDIDLGSDDDSKDSITKQSKFWRWANKEKQKIVIIASIVGSLGVIYTYTAPFLSDAISLGSKNKHTIDTLKQTAKYHDALIIKLTKKIDSIKTNDSIFRYHIIILNDILYSYMQNVVIDGVRFKKAPNGKLYYEINGILYAAQQDQESGQYEYENYDGKIYWCK